MLTPTEKRELEELREKAKTLDGLLYVGDALKYAQLLGQRGLTKPKIMLAARQHRLGAFQPTGGKWWVFPLAGLEAYYDPEGTSDETA
jgi:hypothetical protein